MPSTVVAERSVEGNRTLLVLLIAAAFMLLLIWLLTRTGVI
jgi:hypothetical protein